MHSPEAFEDLVDPKRRFLALDAEIAAFARTLPAATAVVAGTAVPTASEQDAWKRLWDAHADLAVRILGHRAFDGLGGPERLALDEEASRAAKETSAAA